MTGTKQKYTAKRIGVYGVGMVLYAFGASLITKAGLGISPVTSVMYVISVLTGLSLGTVTLLVNLGFFAIQVLWLGSAFTKRQFMQIPALFLFSFLVDVTMLAANQLVPHTFWGQIVTFAVALTIMSTGISASAGADIALPPGDGLAKTIAFKRNIEFWKAKVIIDCSMVCLAVAISLVGFGRIIGVHIGTLVSALMLGTMVRIVSGQMRKMHLIS